MRILILLSTALILSSCGFNFNGKWEPVSIIKAKKHNMFDWYQASTAGYVYVHENKIYAFTKEDIFVSTDEGINWVKTNFNGIPDTLGISDIVSSGNLMAASTSGAGVFISTDNGVNWKPMNNGLFDTVQFKIDCIKDLEKEKKDSSLKKMTRGVSDSDEWYGRLINDLKAHDVRKHMVEKLKIASIAISGKTILIYREYYGFSVTSDNGAHWEKVEIKDDTLVEYNTINFASDEKSIFAYSYHLIHRSQDGGKTWKKLRIEIPPDTAYIGEGGVVAYEKEEINTMCIKGKVIYAGTNNGLFVSNDEGKNWKAINNGLPTNKPISAITYSGSTLFVCPGDYQGIYISNDEGKNWKRFSEGMRKNTEIQYHCGSVNYFTVTAKNIYAGVWTNGECPDALWVRPLSDAEE